MISKVLHGPILIVEDDKKTASLVELYLQRDGFQTLVAHDGQQALKLAQRHKPIFVILDLMLPVVDGWDVCRKLRKSSDVPILMLTARGEEVDRISGLTLGADDYVAKPFSPHELVARVKAVLRRGRLITSTEKSVLSHGGLVMDLERRKVSVNDRPVPLTPHEYRLLQALMGSPGRVFTRDELLAHLYPSGEAVIDRVIDVHIGKIRHKIEKDPSNPQYIKTVRGLGYQFEENQVHEKD
ncbi:MAG: response regulator transcription factor [Deltaproteobacteria bacterium]|nr:MAG: response regulator transcription factor [Deltaproteobacteria bacterium]